MRYSAWHERLIDTAMANTTHSRFALRLTALAALPLLLSTETFANSLYVGYNQTQLISQFQQLQRNYEPSGLLLLGSVDVAENWSLSGNLSALDEDFSIPNAIASVDVDSWGASISHFRGDWSYSLSLSNWQQDGQIRVARDNRLVAQETNDATGVALNVSKDWFKGNWQFGLGAGLSYSDWEAQTGAQPLNIRVLESATSTFANITLTGSYIVPINSDMSLLLGANINWQENISSDDENTTLSRLNPPPNGGRAPVRQLNSVAAGTESYGTMSFYLAWQIDQHWSIDADANFDIDSEDSLGGWSVSVGYFF